MAKKGNRKSLPVSGLSDLPDAVNTALEKVLVLNAFRLIEEINNSLSEAAGLTGAEKDDFLETTLVQANMAADSLIDLMESMKKVHHGLFTRFGTCRK